MTSLVWQPRGHLPKIPEGYSCMAQRNLGLGFLHLQLGHTYKWEKKMASSVHALVTTDGWQTHCLGSPTAATNSFLSTSNQFKNHSGICLKFVGSRPAGDGEVRLHDSYSKRDKVTGSKLSR
mmetsp:Transcript_29171/g.73314  ORF Transcript_29171/g.73314 Transcript_29171/m.73314 type:complete len:122 (-) Transcript_29171:49-414(-)